ncbi:deoxyribose-phosphate aldolase [Otariodibacter oris]|uniref:YnbE-like lipoprotein n=1 Tax=Otariodibacter oris TaxID=1032623 RepID=A0A420XFE9_9PAST|nr:deoxyribose-phosphate aldolase [Otariodibacter oris]QGM81493.1 deoxyribose-phosphate aldolase [Otariodibacter oris]RKR71099.1 hypothetical protein DES31_1678 [Otariodibacter oris]
MKKFSLVILTSMILAACTAGVYTNTGNATILSSRTLTDDTVELTIQKDDGQIVKMNRQYDAHATVGARVTIDETQEDVDSQLDTIRRYEFK